MQFSFDFDQSTGAKGDESSFPCCFECVSVLNKRLVMRLNLAEKLILLTQNDIHEYRQFTRGPTLA